MTQQETPMQQERTVAGRPSALRSFLASEAAGGLVLIGVTALALAIANSPLSEAYFGLLSAKAGGLSVLHWINDALMALFFLVVGLEIKREVLEGQLATWPQRVLPGIAALGGMIVPALIYLAVTRGDPSLRGGWAIPAATDIAFALGVLALLGPRVPASLKIFLTALAILDDLGAIVIIAVFYTEGLSLPMLGGAALCILALVALNRFGVRHLLPYLALGGLLWVLVLWSGIHATLAGVALALTIPLAAGPRAAGAPASPLHRLEHGLHPWVVFAIIPIFGFANAGVSFAATSWDTALGALPVGIALGLSVGKLVGVFGVSLLVTGLGFAALPAGASRLHFFGVALLCGIGFTMSLFIGALAFPDRPDLTDPTKIGVLSGSVLSALVGWAVLRFAPRAGPVRSPVSSARP